MKFNAVDTLISQHGFELKTTRYPGGAEHDFLTKTYSKTVDVAFRGPMVSELTVEILLNASRDTLRVSYWRGNTPFKIKTHLNDKRAYNAIRDTLDYHGFTL